MPMNAFDDDAVPNSIGRRTLLSMMTVSICRKMVPLSHIGVAKRINFQFMPNLVSIINVWMRPLNQFRAHGKTTVFRTRCVGGFLFDYGTPYN